MTRPGAPFSLVLLAIVTLLAMAFAAWFEPRDAAAAWLCAFGLVAGAPIGALSLLLVGRLTGGVWFTSIETALKALSLLVPLAGLAALVVLIASPLLYPWASQGAEHVSVGRFYLNAPLVVLRTLVAFAGWTVLAFDLLPTKGTRGQIAAGLGLVFHAVLTTFVAYDWLLALTPGFTSSAFGTETIIVWMLEALTLATLLSPVEATKAAYDIAGLMIAMILGAGYMVFMQFLIIWYGDLPDTVPFYLDRENPLGLGLLLAALGVGLVIPLASFAFEPVRGSIARIRVVALFILAGIAFYRGWCVLPMFDPLAAILAPLAAIFLAAFFALGRPWMSRFRRYPAEMRHGQ